ncbi:hypothetical protein [Variovorax sp. GT1P44]|uniref:hypothetical protein n=1 Tax=Variovorax sp. GT1P44 TaxID=3443742 RepID=UPI003F45B0D1
MTAPDPTPRRDATIAEALLAVESVLVRATAVTAHELRRVHSIHLPAADVLLMVNDVLNDVSAQEDGSQRSDHEIERLIVDHTIAAVLAARATLLAGRRR